MVGPLETTQIPSRPDPSEAVEDWFVGVLIVRDLGSPLPDNALENLTINGSQNFQSNP